MKLADRRDVALAASLDAGNRSMRNAESAGDRADAAEAAREFNRLYPLGLVAEPLSPFEAGALLEKLASLRSG